MSPARKQAKVWNVRKLERLCLTETQIFAEPHDINPLTRLCRETACVHDLERNAVAESSSSEIIVAERLAVVTTEEPRDVLKEEGFWAARPQHSNDLPEEHPFV
eukprot:CAMPEP_0177363740 /NCGR_PEP_ID=MMETSP0368-20130122/38416_1 /TAXON_ID=447022 ORGANISM="Scrippsiella hangoei-like, Strain SHHI-4" /NCGR_SAMPLE_ID=MMETSP0368 /ASSEMBLY_ACC=CAM_ASM_000363 /LENGTH=103 /DNA_ID=CAMNT_0018826551 /DNA_START=520 /DNA_END=828 /DNA_ORIENTATION=-